MIAVDLRGQHFGRLRVIKRVGKTPSNKAIWKCRCVCGNATSVITGDLKSGNTRSCGCGKVERCRDMAAARARGEYRHKRTASR